MLNKHFKNADDARLAVEQIEMIVENKIYDWKDNLPTKDDFHQLEKGLIAELHLNKENIQQVKLNVLSTKVEIMRWMFGIFRALMLAIAGLYFKS